MDVQFRIPDGEKKIFIELTVKEALALSEGIHFPHNHELASGARKKITKSLESQWVAHQEKIDYATLNM
ncbi:MAG: hypothetical protein A2189_06095 [Paenibacillus sp. RIFOXYA1_FULL_44_5]|nr:MAG: hypothetical protein A2189_06095 [Paenibacillus sp. RIFOXYA1_FULL_44_5]